MNIKLYANCDCDYYVGLRNGLRVCKAYIDGLEPEYEKCKPSSQPERLTDEDFETIRIHLNAYKGQLCNQYRWEEAEEYQRIIDRFIALASAQPEQKTGKWIKYSVPRCGEQHYKCTSCGYYINFGQWGELYTKEFKYCPNCGCKMERGGEDGTT